MSSRIGRKESLASSRRNRRRMLLGRVNTHAQATCRERSTVGTLIGAPVPRLLSLHSSRHPSHSRDERALRRATERGLRARLLLFLLFLLGSRRWEAHIVERFHLDAEGFRRLLNELLDELADRPLVIGLAAVDGVG